MGCSAPWTGGAPCVCVRVCAHTSRGFGQLSGGCQASVRDQRLPETGAAGRSSFQSPPPDLVTQ